MRVWALSIDAPPGTVQAVLADLRSPLATSPGTYYDTDVSVLGEVGHAPYDLAEVQVEFRRRGYRTDLS